ncbi:hypothetical protein MRX96_002427 [Rhipicephalus microplus]
MKHTQAPYAILACGYRMQSLLSSSALRAPASLAAATSHCSTPEECRSECASRGSIAKLTWQSKGAAMRTARPRHRWLGRGRKRRIGKHYYAAKERRCNGGSG